MGLLDKAKQAAEQAAARAKEGVEDVQTKRELSQAYGDLGRSAFGLIESGALSDSRLDAAAAKIRALEAKLEEAGGDGTAAAADPAQPPAMPT
jgi:outer membrane murein-binding lipoprotein Lpp